ncbi:MAG TPA: GTP-binding protein [Treponema sp.]|nr:GTP-binding protein [Treponema sp.]
MIKKKICLLGSFAVGKTSLIKKYVLNIFSDTYLSTVGVKIDKKILRLSNDLEVTLMIWDLEGKDDFQSVADTYLRGLSGYIMVADGTRPDTLDSVTGTWATMKKLFPGLPTSLLLNKSDLKTQWLLDDQDYAAFSSEGIPVSRTSAKTGKGVEEAFIYIAEKMTEINDVQ